MSNPTIDKALAILQATEDGDPTLEAIEEEGASHE